MITITVIGISSEIDVLRGVITHHKGKVELMNEFVLVKINTDLIKENEENLLELRITLAKLERNVTDRQIQRSMAELKISIDNELQEKTPQKISEKELEIRNVGDK